MKLITGDIYDLKIGDIVKSYKDPNMSKYENIKLTDDCENPKEVNIEGGIVERNLSSNGKRIFNLYIPCSFIPEPLITSKSFSIKKALEIKKCFDNLNIDKKPYRSVMSPHIFLFSLDTKIKYYRINIDK